MSTCIHFSKRYIEFDIEFDIEYRKTKQILWIKGLRAFELTKGHCLLKFVFTFKLFRFLHHTYVV